MMHSTILAIGLWLACYVSVTVADVTIVPPLFSQQPQVDSQPGTHVGLIFSGGFSTPPAAYLPLVQEIQRTALESFGVSVWASMVSVPLDAPVANGVFDNAVHHAVKVLRQNLADAHVATDNNFATFYAGHAKGGMMMQTWVQHEMEKSTLEAPFSPKAALFYASTLQRKFRADKKGEFIKGMPEFPFLTVGGELDGMTRVSRVAEAFYHQLKNTTVAKPHLVQPVVVLSGVNHMGFASGAPSMFVRKNDLAPEVDEKEGHAMIARVTSAFLAYHAGSQSSKSQSAVKVLEEAYAQTDKLIGPMVEAMLLEGSYHFRPPCHVYSDDVPSVDPIENNCWVGSLWSARAQAFMGQVDVKYDVTDQFHEVWRINPVHLPHLLNNCSEQADPCTLVFDTVTQNVYDDVDERLDTGFNPVAANEVRIKLKSRQTVHEAAGVVPADFKTLDGPMDICAKMNQIAIDWAKEHAPAQTLKRFEAIGVKLVPGEDAGPYGGGPGWIWHALQYNTKYEKVPGGRRREKGEKYIELRSPTMATPSDYWAPLSRGFHYCKLLSPARALEWMMVDGLKDRGGLASAGKLVMQQ